MITAIAIGGFVLAGISALVRVLVGPSLADRVAALDVVLLSAMGAIAVDAARRDDPSALIVLVVMAVVGFTATVAAARYIMSEDGP